ncbi:MAG: SpoIVB peptidase [Clostridiales bacterium]|jgi:stage IV sporulation protein B|nr:SpoIVB peptidase [Clostridiales bacterium]
MMKKKGYELSFYQKFFSVSVIVAFVSFLGLMCSVGGAVSRLPDSVCIIQGRQNNVFSSFELNAEYTSASMSADESYTEKANEKTMLSINGENTEAIPQEMQVALFGVTVKNVSLDILPDEEVIPCGMTVGVNIASSGIMVLGLDSVETTEGRSIKPAEKLLKAGDVIISANGVNLSSKEEFIKIIEACDGKSVALKIKRDSKTTDISVMPQKSATDGKYKVGVWVRDGTQGVGTLTYYDAKHNIFGALGHGVLDVDTRQLIPVKSGLIMDSSITSIKKGRKGSPGELVGQIDTSKIIGSIELNTPLGLYGKMETIPYGGDCSPFKIALKSDIHEGPAKIRSNIYEKSIKEYDVYIESVNRYGQDDSKGMVLRVTDAELLSKTNGIVQGMSGSPIIQDGRLIGAVTHVFVQNPSRGYGVFIENMLKQEKRMLQG